MRQTFLFILLLHILTVSAAQPPSLQNTYDAFTVKRRIFSLSPKLYFGSYHSYKSSIGRVSSREIKLKPYSEIDIPLPVELSSVYSKSTTRQKFHFSATDTSGQQAMVYCVATQKLTGGILTLFQKQVDSIQTNTKDYLVGTMLIKTLITKDVWNLVIHNPNQIKGSDTEGSLSNGIWTIQINENKTPKEYVQAGQMQEALLSESIQKGFLFTYNQQVIGGVDMQGENRGFSQRPVAWIKKGLDPNLRFVVANLITVLVNRQNLKTG